LADEERTPAATAADEHVAVGRVGKAHGLDGAFHVTRPRLISLQAGDEVVVAGASRRIARRGGTEERPTLVLEGVVGREAAEALRGSDLLVPRAALPPLDEDEFWPDDLVGLAVRSRAGNDVGTVTQVLGLPSCDVLEVRRPAGGELLVPLIRDAVPELDLEARLLTVDLDFLDEPEPGGEG
jgi:16S rRNA processing protein RimM